MGGKKVELDAVFSCSNSTHHFDIHWTRIGDATKPPLVFIHGTPWSSVEWHDLALVLRDHFCIYLYDHPGFGHSPQPRRLDGKEPDLDGSLALRAQASAALFDHFKFSQPPHVVAHDNGGLVSLRLFLEHGIKFVSLCLMDVVAMGPFGLPIFNVVANNQSVFEQIPARFVDGFVRSYIRGASHKGMSPEVEDSFAQQWSEGGTQGPARFLQEMVQAHNRTTGDLEKRYGDVGKQIPVKVMWGANDSWLPPEIAHRLATALNAQKVVLIEEAGHLVQYDNPSKLAFELGIWLMQQA
ncbi:MAG: hypothetical protein Q9159_002209 [Coniocarpon cinnabarinum]